MKQRFFASIVSLFLVLVLCVTAQSLNVQESEIRLTISQNKQITQTIHIQNTGAADVDPEFSFVSKDLDDNDGDEITITFPSVGLIPANQTAEAVITINTPKKIDFENYEAVIQVKDKNTNDVDEFTLKLAVEPDTCDAGQVVGGLSFTVENPDSDEDFEPGDTVSIKVDVQNDAINDQKIQVEAFLFSEGGKEIASGASQSLNIENGDEETFTFDLEIPIKSEVLGDTDDTFILFIKTFNDNNEALACVQQSVPIDIQSKNKKLVVDKENTEFLPQTAQCGDSVIANVKIFNVGKKDNKVTFALKNKELKVDQTSQVYIVDGFGAQDDNAASHKFTVHIPQNAKEKLYAFDLIINGEGNALTEKLNLNVFCNKNAGFIEEGVNMPVVIKPLQKEQTVTQGQFIALPIEITNNRQEKTVYTVTVKNIYEIAQSTSKSMMLEAGQTSTIFMEIKVKEDAVPALYTGTIEVRDNTGIVASEGIQIKVEPSGEQAYEFESYIKAVPVWFWIIINVLLIGSILVIVKLATQKK